jgi:hypothetical protein
MEYTDLELNKMIAELEGLTVCDKRSINNILMIKLKNQNKSRPEFRFAPYFPNYFDLMVKYKVCIEYQPNLIYIGDNHDIYFKSESEIPRAIIMCILKSKNII